MTPSRFTLALLIAGSALSSTLALAAYGSAAYAGGTEISDDSGDDTGGDDTGGDDTGGDDTGGDDAGGDDAGGDDTGGDDGSTGDDTAGGGDEGSPAPDDEEVETTDGGELPEVVLDGDDPQIYEMSGGPEVQDDGGTGPVRRNVIAAPAFRSVTNGGQHSGSDSSCVLKALKLIKQC